MAPLDMRENRGRTSDHLPELTFRFQGVASACCVSGHCIVRTDVDDCGTVEAAMPPPARCATKRWSVPAGVEVTNDSGSERGRRPKKNGRRGWGDNGRRSEGTAGTHAIPEHWQFAHTANLQICQKKARQTITKPFVRGPKTDAFRRLTKF